MGETIKRILVCIAVLVALSSGTFAAKAAASKSATKINPKDGSVMITIPAGKFIMGSNHEPDEKPVHTVYLDTYQIGKCEVTIAQYRKFCKATGYEMPDAPSWGWKHGHPIVNVTWNDAAAYCKWAGGRLPTEAEWEKAAAGTDGRTYPWGDAWDNNKCANVYLNLTSTQPVGSYPAGASAYGCMDMAGNVWEWCADVYAKDYYKASPSRNPRGPSRGGYRVMRGGSWDSDSGGVIGVNCGGRCADRSYLDNPGAYSGGVVGFRLAH
ncbi:MAG: formylglycine-generating enzyme family protein [Armatimonadota bacterium]|nr:formylglycine-generating enzyme family protein [Armatimonadota bacterium]